jgi:molybdopterin synthase sulfur carrier subunit
MTIQIEVTLFARAKDLAGTDKITLTLPTDGTVGDLRLALGEHALSLRPYLSNLLIALGTDYATDSTPIGNHNQAACFPPVSGG